MNYLQIFIEILSTFILIIMKINLKNILFSNASFDDVSCKTNLTQYYTFHVQEYRSIHLFFVTTRLIENGERFRAPCGGQLPTLKIFPSGWTCTKRGVDINLQFHHHLFYCHFFHSSDMMSGTSHKFNCRKLQIFMRCVMNECIKFLRKIP